MTFGLVKGRELWGGTNPGRELRLEGERGKGFQAAKLIYGEDKKIYVETNCTKAQGVEIQAKAFIYGVCPLTFNL